MEADLESGEGCGDLMGRTRPWKKQSTEAFGREGPRPNKGRLCSLHVLPGADRLRLEQPILPVCVQKLSINTLKMSSRLLPLK